MLNLNCKIKVHETKGLHPTGKVFQFSHVKDIRIQSSYKNFTDTATITIPKAIVTSSLNNSLGIELARRSPIDFKQRSINEFFKIDYLIEVFLGYNGEYKPAFRGYIREVKGDAPVQIVCDDMMYYLKKYKMIATDDPELGLRDEEKDDDENEIPRNNNAVVEEPIKKLKQRLENINVPFEVAQIEVEDLGTRTIDRKWNIVEFLNNLKEDFDVYSFMRLEADDDGNTKSVLHVTSNPCLYKEDKIKEIIDKYDDSTKKVKLPVRLLNRAISLLGVNDVVDFFRAKDPIYPGEGRFRFHYNIINDNLKITEEEVKKVKVRAEISYVNSNVPIPEEIGDPDGSLVKRYVFHNNKEELDFNNPVEFKKKKEEIKGVLKTIAGVRLARLKQTGVTGSITTFGEPFIRPLDNVSLENAEDAEKNNVFQVEEVERSYGIGGYRQVISLGRLLEEAK